MTIKKSKGFLTFKEAVFDVYNKVLAKSGCEFRTAELSLKILKILGIKVFELN